MIGIPGKRALGVFLLAGVLSVPLLSQPAQQAPVFRSGVRVVPLVVSVVDKKGVPVTNLRREDFTVVEDDQPREIVAFESETDFFVPRPPSAESATLNRVAKDAASPETRRTILIVLGFGRIQYPTKAIDGVIEFVRDQLLPQDAIAVMGFNRSTDFTTDHSAILRFLERYKKAHEKLSFDISEFWVFHRYEPLSEALQESIDAIFLGPVIGHTGPDGPSQHDGSIRDVTAMLLGMDEALNGIAPRPDQVPATLEEIRREAYRSRWELSDLMVATGILKIYAGLEYLRHLDGQKHLVFLGPGLGLAGKDDDENLARRFNHAGVTLHVVGTAGSGTGADTVMSLRNISSLTGGLYSGVTYANQTLAAVDRASRSSYVIGYTPGNAEQDGKYHKVIVKVGLRDAVVRFPGGYYATTEADPVSRADVIAQSRLESAMFIEMKAGDIGLTAEAVGESVAGGFEVSVSGRIDAAKLTFTQKGFLRSIRVGLVVTALDPKRQSLGSTIGRLSNDVGTMTAVEYRTLGVPFFVKFPALSKPQSVRIVAYDYGADLMGSLEIPIR